MLAPGGAECPRGSCIGGAAPAPEITARRSGGGGDCEEALRYEEVWGKEAPDITARRSGGVGDCHEEERQRAAEEVGDGNGEARFGPGCCGWRCWETAAERDLWNEAARTGGRPARTEGRPARKGGRPAKENNCCCPLKKLRRSSRGTLPSDLGGSEEGGPAEAR